MILKKKEFFLLIFLILLQSCSGGRVANFLESSFNDLEKISQDRDSQKNLENQKSILENQKINNIVNEKIKKVENPKNVLENKKNKKLERLQKKKINKIKNSPKKRKIDLQSYKIIFIIKDVDPKDPTKDLNTILGNSEVNFEIEKIERILDSENKGMNKN